MMFDCFLVFDVLKEKFCFQLNFVISGCQSVNHCEKRLEGEEISKVGGFDKSCHAD